MFIGKGNGTKLLVNFLIQNYFLNLRSILIIYNSNNLNPLQIDYLNAISETFNNYKSNYVIVQWINVAKLQNKNFNETVLQHTELGTEGFITVLANTSEFLKARYYATQISIQRLKNKYFLFLSEIENPKLFFHEKTLKYYPSHILVVKDINDNFKIWTQNYVGLKDGENEIPLLLNIFFISNKTFLYNSTLYPNKLNNLKGRVVRVAAINYVPYVVNILVPPGTGNVDSVNRKLPGKNIIYSGCEGKIILEYCILRNCTIRVEPYGSEEWGDLYENGSSDGMFGAVYRNEVDFAVGSIYNLYSDEFEVSFGIAKSGVRLMGPAPNRYPAYLTNILPFNGFVWLLILISIFIGSFVLHIVRYSAIYFKLRQSRKPFKYHHTNAYFQSLLEILAIFFQQSFPVTGINSFAARFFITALLLAALTLENSYSGQLKSLLTIPLFMDPVDTFEKFAKTDWKWGAPSDSWVLSIKDSDIPVEKIMADKFEIHSQAELKNLTYKRNFGFTVEKLHGGGFTFGNYIRDGEIFNLILIKDELFFEYTRGIGIRGWPLMDGVNVVILWCLEHGLYYYWEKLFLARYVDRRTQDIILALETGHIDKPLPEILNIVHLSGPVFLLIIGWILSFLIFLCEILIRKIRKNDIAKIWLERQIFVT